MGVRLAVAPHLFRLLSPEDQKLYGQTIAQTTIPVPTLGCHSSPKSSVAERRNRATSRTGCCYRTANATERRKSLSSGTPLISPRRPPPGTPDFFVGVSGHAMWIEFKKDRSCHLTQEQDEFRLAPKGSSTTSSTQR
jgi:hypothetical protein